MAKPVHLPESDEYPHRIGGDVNWQESVFIWWRDTQRPIGGIFRLGHEPNRVTAGASGRAPIWFGVQAGPLRFHRTLAEAPLDTEADRPGSPGVPAKDGPGLTAGDGWSFLYDGGPRIRVHQPGVELALDVEDLYPRTDFFAKDAGSLADDYAAGHFEASGRARGRLTLDGEAHEIDAWCHRDHSWGERRWDTLLSHRWASGCAGPALSFGSIAWHSVDGNLARFGYVVRDGEVTIAETVDMTVHMACDALTYTGGEITWRLPGGDVVTVAPRVDAAWLNLHEGIAFVDALCTFDYQGRTGFCDLEVTANPRRGTGPVTQCLLATRTDGLSRITG